MVGFWRKKKKEKRLSMCGELVCTGFGLMIEGEWKIYVLRMEGKKCWWRLVLNLWVCDEEKSVVVVGY